jgi:hypothetical protein
LGKWDVPGYLLTSSESMPYDDNNLEAVRPAPPPPTIKTGTVMSLKISSFGLAIFYLKTGVKSLTFLVGMKRPRRGMFSLQAVSAERAALSA